MMVLGMPQRHLDLLALAGIELDSIQTGGA